ncbi:hypothetical protein E2C01_070677 [Portunus trituberculatus]|uniref:Uncharacterized protein n=1 Tax=Portunus trituberculatus TaxID=210409 RepID=A0A5B7HUT4_PORTR|nr:hypothetical protein [Portunus trituberculatus]
MQVGVCHTAPMTGSQTPIWDIDGGICHMGPMSGGQPLIPSLGFMRGTGKKMSGAPGIFGSVYGGGLGDSHLAVVPGGRPTTLDTEVGVCHTAPMPGSQTPLQDVEVGICHTAPMLGGQLIIASCGLGVVVSVCPSAPMSGTHPLPHSGLGHVDPGESMLGS